MLKLITNTISKAKHSTLLVFLVVTVRLVSIHAVFSFGSHSHSYGEQPGYRRSVCVQILRGLWGSYRWPLPALLHGSLLAHALPQVLMLSGSAGWYRHHLLQQRRHDPLQNRLHQVRRHPSYITSSYKTLKCAPGNPSVLQVMEIHRNKCPLLMYIYLVMLIMKSLLSFHRHLCTKKYKRSNLYPVIKKDL